MNSRRTCLVAFLILSTIGLDQFTKVVAKEQLSSSQPLIYLSGMVRLQYTQNRGAFLSLGARLPEEYRFWILTIGVSLLLAGVVFFLLFRKLSLLSVFGLSWVVGGGVGNLIDRFDHGSVIDFMNVGIGNLRTGIFNVADMAIMAGIGCMLLDSLKPAKKVPGAFS